MWIKRSAGGRTAVLLAILTLATGLATGTRAGFDEQHTFTADELLINNLIGELRVKGGGSTFEVSVRVQGRDASRDEIQIKTREGGQAELSVIFPRGQKRFVYPNMGRGSRTSFTMDHEKSGWLSSLLGKVGGDRITVTSSGSGMEVWADIEVSVPSGKSLKVHHGVGQLYAENVNGDLILHNHSGPVQASRIDGELEVDTGSGSVRVEYVNGALLVDTGSGSVTATDCDGDVVNIDTGSGSVKVERIVASKLRIDTGSGSVRASSVSADSALIDTGSGSVTLELDKMGTGDFRIDTGSGRVTLKLPPEASAEVRAETGSGGIDLGLDSPVELKYKDRNEIAFTVGSGAARVVLDTGSGGIRITN